MVEVKVFIILFWLWVVKKVAGALWRRFTE